MIKRLFLSFTGILSFLVMQAQCEPCSSQPDGSIDFCYTDSELPDRCAQFSYAGTSFKYDNPSNKKNPVLELPVPEANGGATIAYLAELGANKKYKLGSEDLLFLERALARRADWMALKNWDIAQINQGFTITNSGLAYKVLTQGSGPKPEKGKKVSVHYTGYFTEGKKFDSSRDRGSEFQFSLGLSQVIKGWDEGVALMNVGSRYLFRIPPNLAYGERGYPGAIPPNSTLYFDVQLIAVP